MTASQLYLISQTHHNQKNRFYNVLQKVFTHIILTWIFSTQLPLTHAKKEKGLPSLCKSS